ncbi:hypothetical protein [Pedobacter rhizosphaerae]|uniref:Uncharacterized protein n=1 Tax=Pedobacter rhizosphaerae TaxID=390241 RepID=A0A1H9TYQ5_9SPHI|nr:hypothetical protein [Pedobacter rhizosphaerae]SES02141.1 hypothetical protein SAMN04488023_12556 [Pedobacter rhizosphaerae]
METIKDQNQAKIPSGEQKVLLDPAITAETDELDPKFEAEQSAPIKNETKANLQDSKPWNSSE